MAAFRIDECERPSESGRLYDTPKDPVVPSEQVGLGWVPDGYYFREIT